MKKLLMNVVALQLCMGMAHAGYVCKDLAGNAEMSIKKKFNKDCMKPFSVLLEGDGIFAEFCATEESDSEGPFMSKTVFDLGFTTTKGGIGKINLVKKSYKCGRGACDPYTLISAELLLHDSITYFNCDEI